MNTHRLIPKGLRLNEINETGTCWICGNIANSSEHWRKRSDVVLHVGEITQQRPLYRIPDTGRHKIVQGPNSRLLKFKQPICNKCNSSTTQKYDIAWDKMSTYIHENYDLIVRDGYIETSKVFNHDLEENMLFVHLFFLKIFGCNVADEKAPINLKPIASCVRKGIPNRHLFVEFGTTDLVAAEDRFLLETPVHVYQDERHGVVAGVQSYYVVGRLLFRVMYLLNQNMLERPHGSWNLDTPNLTTVPFIMHT